MNAAAERQPVSYPSTAKRQDILSDNQFYRNLSLTRAERELRSSEDPLICSSYSSALCSSHPALPAVRVLRSAAFPRHRHNEGAGTMDDDEKAS